MSMYKKQNSLGTPVHRTNPFDSDSDSEMPSRPSRAQSVPVQRADQFVQELEHHAVIKAEETSSKVNDCVRAAEAIREDATQTLMTLQRQGEQIMYSHQIAADIDRDLTVSEKLLGSLGGLFSKTWRPKRNRQIKGPVSENNSFARTANHVEMEQRRRLGIAPTGQECPGPVHHSPATAMKKIQAEKEKQDDALSDLSNMLGQLKGMALDMGTEIESEKLLGSLGGLFSKTWRPKRNRQIKGPVSENNSFARTANHVEMEQRRRLGIAPTGQECPGPVHHSPATAMKKIQAEKEKQDDALSDLSNMLGQLKGMALDMGTEIERQNKALDTFSDDIDELNFRVKGANQRGRRLLGK